MEKATRRKKNKDRNGSLSKKFDVIDCPVKSSSIVTNVISFSKTKTRITTSSRNPPKKRKPHTQQAQVKTKAQTRQVQDTCRRRRRRQVASNHVRLEKERAIWFSVEHASTRMVVVVIIII